MTLTKADLVNRLYKSERFKKTEAVHYIETLLEIIKSRLEAGEEVLISRFGRFCVRDKRKRRGRNPHTGEDLILEPRRVITFRPSGILKKRVNQ